MASSLDEAAEGFRQYERELSRRNERTTRARADMSRVRSLQSEWTREYRPRFVAVVGELPALERVDAVLLEWRQRIGSNLVIGDLRHALRDVARVIDADILPAYEAARWTDATASAPSGRNQHFDRTQDPIARRLDDLNPLLADTYEQALRDLADETRLSYIGPAGAFREVLRATIHALTPDEDAIKQQSWYKGHNDRPTQAERIRFIMQGNAQYRSPVEAASLAETKVGVVGRELYQRASGAFHVGSEREEVERILGYINAVLLDVLSASSAR